MGARLRLGGIGILIGARHAITLTHRLGCFQHGHIGLGLVRDQPRVGACAVFLGLHHGNAFRTARDHHVHPVHRDLLGRDADGHQAGCALPVHRHARDRHRQACPQCGTPPEVIGLRALLQRRAHDAILDLRRIDSRPLHRMGDCVRGQCGGRRVVERPAIGLADGRAGGRDDDGVAHVMILCLSFEGTAQAISRASGRGRRRCRIGSSPILARSGPAAKCFAVQNCISQSA